MGLSGPPAISNSIFPSCIPSLRSSRDFIVAESYSISYSYRRGTGFKEPGCVLFVEAMLPSENAPSFRSKQGGGKTQHAMSTIKKITAEFHYTGVIKCSISYPTSHSPLHVPNLTLLLWWTHQLSHTLLNKVRVTSFGQQSAAATSVCLFIFTFLL